MMDSVISLRVTDVVIVPPFDIAHKSFPRCYFLVEALMVLLPTSYKVKMTYSERPRWGASAADACTPAVVYLFPHGPSFQFPAY